MKVRTASITVLAAVLMGGCAATPTTQEERAVDPCNFGCQLFAAMFEGLFTAAFDAAFSTSEKREHSRHSWTSTPAPASYAPPARHEREANRTEARHKKHKKERQ